MRGKHFDKLVLVCGCLLAAAYGCGQTGESPDTQAGSSNLFGDDRVGSARGDGGVRDRDKDVDEAADEAAQGAAGGRSHDGRGRADNDADGGVDERDCFGGFGRKRVGFGGRRDGDKQGSGRGEAGHAGGGQQGPGRAAAGGPGGGKQGSGRGEAGHAGGRPGRGQGGNAGGP